MTELPVVVGHRGWPRRFPDNTLTGFLAASAVADAIELDVRRSADGKLVLSHDPTLAGLVVSETPWSVLAELDLGDGHKPALLDEALAARLLEGEPKDDALGQLIAWGPVEAQVRALLGVVHDDDLSRSAKARAALAVIATRWNRERSAPRAPGALDDPGEYVAAWQQWYRDLLDWPQL